MPRTPKASTAPDRASVAGTAPLILGGLLFLGMVILGATTGEAPTENKAVLFGPVFYSLTLMGGLVATFVGFSILEAVLRRRHDPARGWARAALLVLVVLSVLFVVACVFAWPVVALGVAANGLGVSTALLWEARAPRTAPRVYWALLWASLAMVVVAAVWTATAVHNAIS